ncbi:hypothetical protein GYMLUDRAFT_245908 [Collybiopsis luxurians FD-317 M1]|uniref:Unplaced genomic scaffold GYMLUscaffold_35, whole genome shotgun sequence n=1 Tax=Collybiopsis luxurians FD-317 M1 TaxID=944289 RepID=A0A0D0CK72_9AGAR|nr:hypothetical protein GYMLUDRAFT_245908 [Collybiopsis luxurians FD-317 M1]
MTPQDNEKLFILGSSSILNNISLIIISAMNMESNASFAGGLAMMTFVAFYYLGIKPPTLGRQILFMLCFGMLLVFTVVFISNSLCVLLAASIITGKETSQAATGQVLILDDIMGSAQNIAIAIGDSAVVWRAWLLLPEGKFWKSLLTILMFANVGLLITDCVVEEIESLQRLYNILSLDWISLLASIVINLFITLFIAWKWCPVMKAPRATSPPTTAPTMVPTESVDLEEFSELLEPVGVARLLVIENDREREDGKEEDGKLGDGEDKDVENNSVEDVDGVVRNNVVDLVDDGEEVTAPS